jgi:hypothetical protein
MGFSELAIYDYRQAKETNPGIVSFYNDKLAQAQRENKKREVLRLRDLTRKLMT